MFGLNSYRVRLRGLPSGMLCHNGALADPLSDIAKEMKRLSSNRKKTDDIYLKMAQTEWMGGLYLDEDMRPIMPSVNLEGMMTEAAGKLRMKGHAKSAITVINNPLIEHDGPKNATATDLWAVPKRRFIHTASVKIQRNRIMRTRPYFQKWELEFDVEVDGSVMQKGDIQQLLEVGGRLVGLGDYRPKFGKFEVVSFQELN